MAPAKRQPPPGPRPLRAAVHHARPATVLAEMSKAQAVTGGVSGDHPGVVLSVVRQHGAALGHRQQPGQHLRPSRGAGDVGVADPVDPARLGGDRSARVDQRVEQNLAGSSVDYSQLADRAMQVRGLGVQDHRCAGLEHRLRPADRGARLVGHPHAVPVGAHGGVRGDRRGDLRDGRLTGLVREPVQLPSVAAADVDGPHLRPVPVAQLGHEPAHGLSPGRGQLGEGTQGGRLTRAAGTDGLPVHPWHLAQRIDLSRLVQRHLHLAGAAGRHGDDPGRGDPSSRHGVVPIGAADLKPRGGLFGAQEALGVQPLDQLGVGGQSLHGILGVAPERAGGQAPLGGDLVELAHPPAQ